MAPTERRGVPARRMRLRAAGGALAVWAAIAGLTAATADEPAPPPPRTERVLVLAGRGFGHGVGMSQHGARGAALAGLDAPAILAHYYRGATIATVPARRVRVLLADDAGEARLASESRWRVSGSAGAGLAPGPATVTRSGDGLRIAARDGRVVADGLREATFASPTPISVGGRPYRGVVRIVPGRAGVRVVNVVSLERYLPSVVAREMPPSWGDDAPAALRAQAIAARSYAIATASDRGDFDLYDDQRSQVYGGVADEDPRATAAVASTRGEALTYDGKVIVAYYASSSGGRTEDGRNVFPSPAPKPYLTGVDDPYDAAAPLHRWPRPPAYTGREIGERLGLPLPVVGMAPLRLGTSGRALRVGVWTLPLGPNAIVDGPTLRAKLELPDTWFEVLPRSRMPDGGPAPLEADADRADVWLAVLNGTGRAGEAARTARRAEELGYRGVFAGNAPTVAGPDAVYGAPGALAAAERAAADLGIGAIRPLAEAGATEAPAAAQVVVVLGSR